MNLISKVSAAFIFFLLGVAAFPVIYMMCTGDFPGANVFYGLEEDSAVVDWLLTVRDAVTF